ncbi:MULTISPECIES: hypothetical protein [unclassified Mesorhizobium]|uniref:hypothetical protein n=1 Tax=unclassified Mesorhizobium TaxID=325217 RepID=UPI00041FA226|nr:MULTISPECIES: hypothetical protein [unclassified Mesorhizobium]WJI84423.1 hypothetical protein NLY34_04365 [Mesorhizobium sp. C374B]WJI90478.1 hypothetical protein NLY42_06775 [Mesorhizobium sp. C372A]
MTESETPHLDQADIDDINNMFEANASMIRKLNDDLRIHRIGGTIVITPGIAGLGPAAVNQIMAAIHQLRWLHPGQRPVRGA